LNLFFSTWRLMVPFVAAVIALLFGYGETFAEPDMSQMVYGVIYGGVTGQNLLAGHHYGIEFSFGYYDLLYHLIPENELQNPDYVARFVNNLGVVFTALFALNLSLMLDKLLGREVAAFTAIGFLFCPLIIPFLASGHPMIGACAFLFLGCWLLLLSYEKKTAGSATLCLVFAFIALTVSLCLRGEVALAFPFVAVAYWVSAKKQGRPSLSQGFIVCLVIAAAFACFLYLQRPFVVSHGGAAKSLVGFVERFASLKKAAAGFAVVLYEFGLLSLLLLPIAGFRFWDKINYPLVIACLILIIPALIFWLPTPSPARHFIFPILGLYVLLGLAWASKLIDLKRSIVMATLLAVGNQTLAEFARPVVASGSYTAAGERLPTPYKPLGFFALDQKANIAMENVLRKEAIELAATKPQNLLILVNQQFYILSRLLVDDPSLRISDSKVGNFDALLLASPQRKIYIIEKFHYESKDVLAEILKQSVLPDYPIYVQMATITPDDKTKVPETRQYKMR
jgi:hypothetical protein